MVVIPLLIIYAHLIIWIFPSECSDDSDDSDENFMDFPTTTARNHAFEKVEKPHANLTTRQHTDSGFPYIMHANGTHTATLIFIHDYGESGHWWRDEIQKIQPLFMKVICPQAIMRKYIKNPDGGEKLLRPSWYNYKSRHYPQNDIDYAGIGNASMYLNYLVNRELDNGILPERIFLGGVSQGAVMALHFALSFTKKLGGVVALSPWKINTEVLDKNFQEVNKDIPILQCHLKDDQYTTIDSAKLISNDLTKHYSKNVQFKEYSEKRHLTTDQSCQDLKNFFKKYLGEK